MPPFRFQLLLLISLIYAGECQLTAHRCPSGWVFYDEQCFRYVNTTVYWMLAESFCTGYNGQLAKPSNWPVNDLLKSIARINSAHCVWLGGNDLYEEGFWVWSITNSPITYTDWEDGEPEINDDKDCLNLYRSYSYKWNEDNCYHHCTVICSRSPIA